jgi:hypothetical protein
MMMRENSSARVGPACRQLENISCSQISPHGPSCHLPITSPSSIIVAGSSFSGKTYFISKLLQNKAEMFTHEPVEILFVYSVWQELYDEMSEKVQGIKFIDFMPTISEIEEFTSSGEAKLLIFDDRMADLKDFNGFEKLFTVFCHHRNLSIILVMQNIFHQAKCLRDISLNVQSIILFKNLRASDQVSRLATQMFPGKKRKWFLAAYEEACIKNAPHGYLMININPKDCDILQLRTKILPDEETIFFLPKSGE